MCNRITDVTPLARLTKLQMLDLGFWIDECSSNDISDITPLAGLTKLTYRGLRGNRASDVTPLADPTNLESLWLINNQITDITTLSGLMKLRILALERNYIDLTPGSPAMLIIEDFLSRGATVYHEPQNSCGTD